MFAGRYFANRFFPDRYFPHEAGQQAALVGTWTTIASIRAIPTGISIYTTPNNVTIKALPPTTDLHTSDR